jgi:HK97 gp10 family phage protein
VAGEGATVEGVDQAAAAYQHVADDAKNMSEPNRRIASAGEQAARNASPVRSGRLSASISGKGTEKDAELGVGVSYWPAQEFGTRYVMGRRFMRAGIEAMRAEAPRAYEDRLAQVISDRT